MLKLRLSLRSMSDNPGGWYTVLSSSSSSVKTNGVTPCLRQARTTLSSSSGVSVAPLEIRFESGCQIITPFLYACGNWKEWPSRTARAPCNVRPVATV